MVVPTRGSSPCRRANGAAQRSRSGCAGVVAALPMLGPLAACRPRRPSSGSVDLRDHAGQQRASRLRSGRPRSRPLARRPRRTSDAGTPPRRAASVCRRGGRQERRQVGAHLLAVLVAIRAVGRQRLHDDASSSGGTRGRRRRRRNDVRVARARQLIGAGGVAASLASAPAASGNSCRPVSSSHSKMPAAYMSVRPSSVLAARLLGRHVADLAVDDPGRRLLELQRRRRQPEVGQLHLAGEREQHVGRRDVAVDELEVARTRARRRGRGTAP